MTPGNTKDEIQRLMASYATGSLNESERRMLYEAALEDQDLFDQLAGEHSLKELIEVPGVRNRLIAKLGPAEATQARVGWKRPLAWGLSATFVVGMSVLAVLVTRSSLQQQNKQVEVAQFNAPAAVPSPMAPAASPSAQSSPEPTALRDQTTLRDQKTPAPKPAPPTSSPAPVVSLDSEEGRAEKKKADASEASLSKSERVETDRLVNGRLDAPKAAAPPPPPPARAAAPASSVVSAEAAAATVQQIAGQLPPPPQVQAQGFIAGQNQQAPQPAPQQAQDQTAQNQVTLDTRNLSTGAAGTASGGGGRFRSAPAPLARSAAKDTAPRFAFEYKVDGEDLVFKFNVDGYFSLHIAPGGLTIVDSHVVAGTTRREHITNNGTEADIVFSAAAQSSTGGVKLTSNLKADTAEDPGRTRIELLVKFYPPPF